MKLFRAGGSNNVSQPTVIKPGEADTVSFNFSNVSNAPKHVLDHSAPITYTATPHKKSSFIRYATPIIVLVGVGSIGTYLLFASHADTITKDGQIITSNITINPTDSTKKNITIDPTASINTLTLSNDGTKIAYTLNANSNSLNIVDNNGSNKKMVTNLPTKDSTNSYYASLLSWSPDNKYIAMPVSDGTGANSNDAWVVSTDGASSKHVKIGATQNQPLGWYSANKLFYGSNNNLCTIGVDGTQNKCQPIKNVPTAIIRQGLCGGFDFSNYQLSPDSKKVLVSGKPDCNEDQTNIGLYTVNVDGSGLTKISDSYALRAVWSPTMTQIALLKYAADGVTKNLVVMNTDGTNQKTVFDQAGSNLSWGQLVETPVTTPPAGSTDTVAPTTRITFPSDYNSSFHGNPSRDTVSAMANDNISVSKLELYIDGVLAQSATKDIGFTPGQNASANFPIKVASLSPGVHTFMTRAYDAAGNVSNSTLVHYVNNYLYTPITPSRLVDTRPGSGVAYAGNTLRANSTLDVQVAGSGGVPASGVSAVVINVAEASADRSTYLTVYPTGTTRPNASTLNATAGQIRNNQTTAMLGANGKLTIYNLDGNTDVVVDVLGYYSQSGNLTLLSTPQREVDTRYGTGSNASMYMGQTLKPGQTLNAASMSIGGANAEDINLTVTNTKGNGFITVYKTGTPRPSTSNINFVAGETLAKQINTQITSSSPGSMSIYNGSSGDVDIIVDVLAGTTSYGTGYVPINPIRITDTRDNSKQANSGRHLSGGSALSVTAAGANGIPAGAKGVVANITVPNTTADTYMTAYASNTSRPNLGSTINAGPSSGIVFNEATIRLGTDGKFNLYNFSGTADAIVDIVGYYY